MVRGYTIELLDADNCVITSDTAETLSDAVKRARYFISDDYARSCESTHEALGSKRVLVKNNKEEVRTSFSR